MATVKHQVASENTSKNIKMLKSYRRFRDALRPLPTQTDLVTILKEMSPEYTFEKRTQALRNLMIWIRLPARLNSDETELGHLHWKNLRFKFFLQFMDRHQEEKEFFATLLKEILSQGIASRLYCMTGVAESSGFWSELADRSMQNLLPTVSGDLDLADLFKNIFIEEEDAEWFEHSSELIIPPIVDMLNEARLPSENLRSEIAEALIILGAQISSLGVSKGIRKRLQKKKFSELPFVRLNFLINSSPDNDDAISGEVSKCYLSIKEIRDQAESTGVSIALIYNLERLSSLLQRMEMLLLLRNPAASISRDIIISHFIGKLIRDEQKRLSIKDFLAEHLQMLTKKIVERSGEKGDHYIATTPEEKKTLFWAASWAGALTAFTAILKVFIGLFHFPIFIEGFFYFINYALGFLLMQKWHLALSSKQPAVMASALSRKFEDFMHTKELSDIANEVRKITVSQVIASFANLLFVVPMVLLIDWTYYYFSSDHIVNAKYAQEILDKHNLLHSFTLFYAALTGVLLWLSSVIGGWIENWIVFRNIPQILRESHVMISAFGKERAKSLTESLAPIIGATAGNISIALLLSIPIVIGKMTGMPLDIRHVTLATGTITLAINSLPWDSSLVPVLLSMSLSILMIGCLNFGVSFYCSIRMAALARGVPSKYIKVIFKYASKTKR
jgi:site-specific recombinase